MKLLNKLFFFLLISTVNISQAVVIETTDMKDIVPYITNDTLVFFDMDGTLINRKASKEGSKLIKAYWRGDRAVRSLDGGRMFVQRQHPIVPMQEMTSALIKDLQQEGVMVLGLTARHRHQIEEADEDMTALQLRCLGISMYDSDYPRSLKKMDNFKRGIIYTKGKAKGPFASECLDSMDWVPSRVVFVDNRDTNCESVDQAMAEKGIECYCFWYRRQELIQE